MDGKQVRAFAEKLMQEVWEPFNYNRLSVFYHEDVVGHHRKQTLNYNDIYNRLRWDKKHNTDAVYDIKDIIAEKDKFSIRFIYTAIIIATGKKFQDEAIYFYHLRDNKIAEFWLLASIDFDYKKEA